jgi:hypothetical protein
MGKHKRLIVIVMTLLALSGLHAKDVELRGMARSYTGVLLSDGALAKNEQTVDLTLEGWGDMTRLVVNPYAYIGIGNEPDIGIREAYVDVFFENADLRIGKQAIMWGQAEGAFITDIVSPRDMRSFILADFREIRKGIPAVKADYYAGAFTFEGIWIPQFVPSSLPAQDSIWTRDLSLLPPDKTVTVNPATPPPVHLENSELFGKVRYFGSSATWELMGGYAWTDEPHVASIVPGTATDFIASQAFGRYAVAGGSFSTAIGTVVLRGEAAAYLDKPFSVKTGSNPPLVVEQHHQIQSLVGLDWSLWGTEMSAQYILSYIHNHRAGMVDQGKELREISHTVTLRMQDTFVEDRLSAKLFAYIELDPLNALIRPSLSWSLEDGVSLEGGLEVFLGDASGMFGAYRDNTMAFIALRWYF